MEIEEAIRRAEESLQIFEQRMRFIDCYEQTVGYVAEAIKKAADEAVEASKKASDNNGLSFSAFYTQ